MGKKDPITTEENGEADLEEAGVNVKGGKKSKKSKKKDYDEDDIAKELEELQLEVNGEKPKPKAPSKQEDGDSDTDGVIQPTIGGGFAALMEDDDNDAPAEQEPQKEIESETKKESKPETNKKEKGKKGKRRKGNDDDDDIDDLLAEIEAEYTGVKKKETKKEEPITSNKVEDQKAEPEPSSEEQTPVDEAKAPLKTKSADTKKAKETTTKKNEKVGNEAKRDTNEPKKDAKTKGEEKPSKEDSKKKDKKNEDAAKAKEKEEESKKKKKAAKTAKEDKKKEEEDAKEEAKARKGKPNKKMLEAMKLMLEQKREEEERQRREEDERERQEEERIRLLEEQRRLEEERKEKLKQKQKDRQKRLKDEGKLLTPKQRMEQKRAQAMLAHLKAQGVAIPDQGEKVATSTIKRQKRRKQELVKEEVKEEAEPAEAEKEEEKEEEEEEEDDDVADAWDQMSEEEEEEEEETEEDSVGDKVSKDAKKDSKKPDEKAWDSDAGSEASSEDHQTEAEKRREKAVNRMQQRKLTNEKNKNDQKLRAPVVCVLGHVDHGKTKILDKLRRTNVQEGEVGGITQQIGATNVPFDAVKTQTRMVKDFDAESIRLPGLLIIDTPGHESFSNLRTRGSSLCDIAILVVDITQGLEPQTIESINLLKTKKTPFIVALNKVDRVFEWESNSSKDIREVIKLQNEPCKNDFDRRTAEVIQALNNQGLNASLFWENPDPRSYVSLVPTSAISGDGMGNLIALIASMCQKRLAPRLMFSEELQCTVLEVKTIQGHGTTIDVILINGQLKEGDTIILAGTEGPIVTQIRSLLIPKPMKEIRVKGQYDELKVVQAALGVKLAARELEKAIAGLYLQVALHDDEVEILREDVDREFKTAMRSIKVKDKGVYVQASTLGALEALLEFFKTNKVPYAGIRVGPVVKRDVMKAAAMLEHDPVFAVILAFDVKVERDAQELADKEGVKIFSEETIYHLGDRYVDYMKEYKKKKQDEFRHVAVFPSKLKIIPDAIFNKRDPIVLGVTVDQGILRTGTPLCVPSKEFVDIGVVTSLEFDHKVVDIAKKGVSVCMKVEPLPGHTPKLFGRHFDADDVLISKISRESIDACKQYFRDDLGKTEWKLMAELKKQFNIL